MWSQCSLPTFSLHIPEDVILTTVIVQIQTVWQTIKTYKLKANFTRCRQYLVSNMSPIMCRISLDYFFLLWNLWNELFGENRISCTFTYQSCLWCGFHGFSGPYVWVSSRGCDDRGSHSRKWQHQFSHHPLPGTLLYTVLLKGNDACIGSLAWIGMFVVICHDWDDRIVCHLHVWELCPPLERTW